MRTSLEEWQELAGDAQTPHVLSGLFACAYCFTRSSGIESLAEAEPPACKRSSRRELVHVEQEVVDQ